MAKKFLTPVVPPNLDSDPAGGTAGAIYYNTASNILKFYNGTNWSSTGSSGSTSEVILPDAKIDSSTIVATTSNVATTIDSFNTSLYTTAKYLIQMKNASGDREITEILITVDGSNNVYVTEYANIITSLDLGSITAVYNAGNVDVKITPTANNITVKAARTLLEA